MNHQNSHSILPLVSVIIPFFNNHDEVVRVEKKLREQSYPQNRFEVIFIDNGSIRPFEFPDYFFERNILLGETNYLNSPYSARNRGIEASKGEIIAFVDANSLPQESWLEEGVGCLQHSDRDLVGGNVAFDFQGRVTAGKVADALTSINMEKAIRERGAAYTANLFVRKKVFDEVGLFEEGVRSGGDVRWTLQAKQHGFQIDYCKSAVVKKYARSTKELYRKKIRTGKGYYQTWKLEPEEERRAWFYNFFRSLKPPTFSKMRNINSDNYSNEYNLTKPAVWFHIYVLGITEQIAFISEYFRNKGGKKNNVRI